MTSTQEKLLSILANRLFDCKTDYSVTDEIMEEARLQTVSLLLDHSDYIILGQNIRVIHAHAELTKLLSTIPFVTIKGYASAFYYPQPSLRTMGDVDFYVESEFYKKAKDTLIENGYMLIGEEHERHESFLKGKVLFELHSEIKGVPNGKEGIKTSSKDVEAKVRSHLSDMVETAETVPTQHGTIVIPDAFHHGLVMLLHVAGHIVNGAGVGLRHLCDWAVYADRVDVSVFSNQLKDMGLWTFACQLTALCTRYLGMTEKEWVGEHDQVFLDEFIEDILSAGNLGKKDSGRYAGLMLSKGEPLIPAFAEMVINRYRIVQDHIILLPGAMAVYCFVFFFERVIGRKKWVTQKNLTDGKYRNRLYTKFKLFS